MENPWAIGTAAVLFLAVIGPPALAQQNMVCDVRETLVDQLGKRFGETRTGAGLLSPNQLLEIWSAPDTGTWTALLTRADGVSCILGSGEHWHQGLPDAIPAGTAS